MTRRRLAGSVALGAATLLMVCAGLGDVPGVATAARALRPVVVALGLDQNWNVFAPEPRREGLRIEAVTDWSDGAHTVWRIPDRGPVLGAYSDYRWRKWAEYAASDPAGRWFWPRAARYVARTLPRRGRAHPVRIRLVRAVGTLPPPGATAAVRWSRTEVYRAQLAPPRP